MVWFSCCHQDTSRCKWTAIARALSRMLCCFMYCIQWRNRPKIIGCMRVHPQIQNCSGIVRTLLSQVKVSVCTCVCMYVYVQVHIDTHRTTYLHRESVGSPKLICSSPNMKSSQRRPCRPWLGRDKSTSCALSHWAPGRWDLKGFPQQGSRDKIRKKTTLPRNNGRKEKQGDYPTPAVRAADVG